MPTHFYLDENGNNGGGGNTIAPETQKQIDEAIANAKLEWDKSLQTKLNESEKKIREKYQAEAKAASMTAEEKAKAESEEKMKSLADEIALLKSEKSKSIRDKAILEAKLPKHYENDVRLINSKDEEVAQTIKVLIKEHDDYLKSIGKASNTTPLAGDGKQDSDEEKARKSLGLN